MKVILPYKQLEGVSIHDEKVMGGIERFGQLVYRNLDNVIPVELTEEDQRKRRVTEKVLRAARHHNGDVILSNYDNETLTSRLQSQIDIPVAWFCHNLGTSISKVNLVQTMPGFVQSGGSIFMVSRYQHDTWDKLSERINGSHIKLDISGYIPSSCCSGSEPFEPIDKTNDITVVARCDKAKDPFSVNRKLASLDSTDITSTVITSVYRSGKNSDYVKQNSEWENISDRYRVLWNLPHNEVMETIARSKVLVSTLPEESFGITALEALSCGVPIILFCKPSLEHASAEIPADDSHVIKLRQSCKPAEFAEAYRTLAAYKKDQRREIYETTQAKHSVDQWVNQLNQHLETTIANYRSSGPSIGTLDGFL